MNIKCGVNRKSCENVCNELYAMVQNVHYGAKWATEQACQDIMKMSLEQVPRLTGTLAESIGYTVEKQGSKRFVGTVSYGNGGLINPEKGVSVSEYVVRQHEDLTLWHPVGKAKFLEDPCNEYASSGAYEQLVAEATRRAIERKKVVEENKRQAELKKQKEEILKQCKQNTNKRFADEYYKTHGSNKPARKRTKVKTEDYDVPSDVGSFAKMLTGE